MGRHFPVREKSGNFEQTGKVRENHTKYWKTEINWDKYYLIFLVIFKWTVHFLVKWIKVSVQKNKTLKKYWKMAKNTGKSGNFVSPEKWEPWTHKIKFIVPSIRFVQMNKLDDLLANRRIPGEIHHRRMHPSLQEELAATDPSIEEVCTENIHRKSRTGNAKPDVMFQLYCALITNIRLRLCFNIGRQATGIKWVFF